MKSARSILLEAISSESMTPIALLRKLEAEMRISGSKIALRIELLALIHDGPAKLCTDGLIRMRQDEANN